MKERAKQTAYDPAKDDHLEDLRSQQEEQEQKLAESKAEKASLQWELKDAANRLSNERMRLANEVSGIDESIGRWKSFQPDAEQYQKVVASVANSKRSLDQAERDVGSSRKSQDKIRNKHRDEVRGLTNVYQQTLQRIFGEEAVGHIQVNANGLQPIPDKKLAPSGAAMSVMTTVLGFDIACVAASMYGVGQHPRFLMHDSPREGEMQEPLFHRLFEVVIKLEEQFTRSEEVSFQYIVTTATELPPKLSEEGYVRETLDKLSDDGLLLRKRF